MTEISPGQKLTRRRALGRRLVRSGSDLKIMGNSLRHGGDLQFLTESELKRVEKLLGSMEQIAKHFNTLGERLDK